MAFRVRINRNRDKSNCKKLQSSKMAIAEAIDSQDTFRNDYFTGEKGHAKQIQAISYTRPSSGICKGRQSTIIPVEDFINELIKEIEKENKQETVNRIVKGV